MIGIQTFKVHWSRGTRMNARKIKARSADEAKKKLYDLLSRTTYLSNIRVGRAEKVES